MSKLIIKTFEIGPLGNFLYVLGDPDTKEAAIIDPAWDAQTLLNAVDDMGFTLTKVFLTHGHNDHVNDLDTVMSKHDVPVYHSKHEPDFLTPPCKNLVLIDEGDTIKLGNIEFSIIHCPGHTPGCIIYKTDNIAFVGDVLFIDGCGRCDLRGGNPEAMYHTLYEKVSALADNTIVYCGHNYGPTPTDTIGHQKQTNPYLTCSSKEEFLSTRM